MALSTVNIKEKGAPPSRECAFLYALISLLLANAALRAAKGPGNGQTIVFGRIADIKAGICLRNIESKAQMVGDRCAHMDAISIEGKDPSGVEDNHPAWVLVLPIEAQGHLAKAAKVRQIGPALILSRAASQIEVGGNPSTLPFHDVIIGPIDKACGSPIMLNAQVINVRAPNGEPSEDGER